MDSLSAMKQYYKVVEAGQVRLVNSLLGTSLRIAADQLDLSKGTVSKQLAKLEAYLANTYLQR